MRNKNILARQIFTCLFLIFEAMTLTPFLSRQLPASIIGILFLFILFFGFLSNILDFKTNKLLLFSVIALSLFILLYKILGVSSASFSKVLYHIMYLILFYIFICLGKENHTNRQILSIAGSIIILVNILDNIRLNIIYPNASELINFYWGTEFLKMNVGDTIFVSMVSMFSIVALHNFLINKNAFFLKLYWLLCYVSSVILVLITSRALALIVSLFGSVIVFLLYINKKSLNKSLKQSLIILILTIFITIFISVVLLTIISTVIKSDRLVSRLNELLSFVPLNGESQTSNVSSGASRISLYLLSIKTWCSDIMTFAFGIGELPSNVEIMNENGVGAHSAVLDLLPQYGLLGFIPMCIILNETRIKIYSIRPASFSKMTSLIVFSLFVFNALTNNVFTFGYIVLIFVISPPYFSQQPSTKYENNKGNSNLYLKGNYENVAQ